ncbi:hypothetical protein [Tsukamurella tyrosinosolvens]|uniref:hypothetical protein n=1 Tax=Tsukamurella tyrosinosolvens TaxID=57704 RepID=UPI002DD42474|nr:hypothetical protein [Tsukamurella tyrosinosolvens]MEC4616426.1 hypothetical protein [Tsukamurella tyrosinosolvens]
MSFEFKAEEIAQILADAVILAGGEPPSLSTPPVFRGRQYGYIDIVDGYAIGGATTAGRLLGVEGQVIWNGDLVGELLFWIKDGRIDSIEFASWLRPHPERWPDRSEVRFH